MRHRVSVLLGSLAAAGALALPLAVPAYAAQGVLHLGFQTYENPSGCYNSAIYPLRVSNQTDTPARVYSGADCQGDVVGIVGPGEDQIFEFGASVFID